MPPAPPPTPNKRVNPFTSQKYSCLWLIKTLLGCHGLGGTANRALSCHQRSQSSSGILPPTPRTPKLEGLPRPQAIPLAKTHTPKDSARKPRAICIFAYNQPFCSREMWKSRRRSRRYPPPSGGGEAAATPPPHTQKAERRNWERGQLRKAPKVPATPLWNGQAERAAPSLPQTLCRVPGDTKQSSQQLQRPVGGGGEQLSSRQAIGGRLTR